MDLSGKIALIGLGYVGLPLAAEFGKTRDVIGLDLNSDRVTDLKAGRDHTLEVNAEQLSAAKNLSFSDQPQDIADADIYIVTVPTPIDTANRPDLTPLRKASSMVGQFLKPGNVVIYESTVYPGCTEEVCVPILEQMSGLTFNVDFFCGYSPERVNPGDKVNTLTKIRKITSGSTPEMAVQIDALYNEIIEAGTFPAASIRVAEAAKVIENTQRDLNIALVNELSVIFNRIGIDTIDVLEAAGSKWNFLPFRPGMVGGHCIGVDPYYLTHKAEEVGYNPQVILAGRRINDNMGRYAARSMVKMMSQNGIALPNARVAVLGVTFKENCPDIRNSKVIDLIEELRQWNVDIRVADPWADADEVREEYGLDLVDLNDIRDMDAIAVAVGHNEFREMSAAELRTRCRSEQPVLADLKALLDRTEARDAGFSIFRL